MSTDQTLEQTVARIAAKSKNYRPLFGADEVKKYYTERLTNCYWDGASLVVVLQVPLVDYEKEILQFISKRAKDSAENDLSAFSLLAIGKNNRFFRLLTMEDIRGCNRLNPGHHGFQYLCNKRDIRIWNKKKLCGNTTCETMDHLGMNIVYDLEETTIMLILDEAQEATKLCDEEPLHEMIKLPKTAMIKLPENCEVLSPRFDIGKARKSEKNVTIKFEVVENHPDLDDFVLQSHSKVFRGIDLSGITEKLGKVHNLTKNIGKVNDEIKATQSHIIIGAGTGGGAVVLVVFVLGCFIWAVYKCAQRLTQRAA